MEAFKGLLDNCRILRSMSSSSMQQAACMAESLSFLGYTAEMKRIGMLRRIL